MRATENRVAIVIVALVATVAVAPARARPPCPRTTERVGSGTWTTRPVRGLTGEPAAWAMGVDERDPKVVVVADFEGILVTRDGGCAWERTLRWTEIAPSVSFRRYDVRVSGGRADVVIAPPWGAPPLVLSSTDGGRTWDTASLPPEATAPLQSAQLVSGYLLTVHGTGHGGVFAAADGEWQRRATTVPGAPAGACAAVVCTGPPLRQVAADLRGGLWGVSSSTATGGPQLLRSAEGSSWEEIPAPELTFGASRVDASPKAVMLLNDFWQFALSRDQGRTWEVGTFPNRSPASAVNGRAVGLAHDRRGATFAAILSVDSTLSPADTLFLFDGRGWENASPGDGRTFTELNGAASSFFVLSSTGELMTFTPRSP